MTASRAMRWMCAISLALALVSILGGGLAGANPLPSAFLIAHVQDVDPDFCETNPLVNCLDVTSYTPDSGVLEFDIFIQTLNPDPVTGADFTLHWPAEWTFISIEFCEGVGVFELGGNEIDVTIDYPVTPDPFHLAVRVVLDATTFGEMWGDGMIIFGGGFEDFLVGLPAEAGRECGDCVLNCSYDEECHPILTPFNLYLEVEQGDIVQDEFDLRLHSPIGWPCPVGVVTDQSWLTAGIEEIDLNHYLGTVTVDAASLPAGEHVGWVTAQSEVCERCLRVAVLVHETSPVSRARWGAIKALYR